MSQKMVIQDILIAESLRANPTLILANLVSDESSCGSERPAAVVTTERLFVLWIGLVILCLVFLRASQIFHVRPEIITIPKLLVTVFTLEHLCILIHGDIRVVILA